MHGGGENSPRARVFFFPVCLLWGVRALVRLTFFLGTHAKGRARLFSQTLWHGSVMGALHTTTTAVYGWMVCFFRCFEHAAAQKWPASDFNPGLSSSIAGERDDGCM